MTGPTGDRMRAALLRTHLREAGFDPDHVMYADDFLRVFSELEFPFPDAAAQAADGPITVWLCHAPGEAFFWRGSTGDVHIDVTKFLRFSGTEHIYVNFVILALLRFHPKLAFSLDLGRVDAYLREISDLRIVRSVYSAVALFSHFSKIHTGVELLAVCQFPALSLETPKRLFPRLGVVELRAIRAILQFPDRLEEICEEIIANWDDEAYMYAQKDATVDDLGPAVCHLITNAGMYATTAQGLAASVREWTERYLLGMRSGEELFVNWGVTIQSHLTRAVAAESGTPFDGKPSVRFGSLPDFYQHLSGRTVLMVSPFAPACAYVVESGRVRRRWKHIEVPEFRLVPLRAFITTYPNRPHGSWSETFAHLCRSVDEIVARENIDLVVGSCGAYGVPLVEYCLSRHGISGVYYGNLTNMLFGVKLNDFAGYFADANLDEWVEPYWGWTDAPPANLDRIDGGRYVIDADAAATPAPEQGEPVQDADADVAEVVPAPEPEPSAPESPVPPAPTPAWAMLKAESEPVPSVAKPAPAGLLGRLFGRK